MGGVVANSGLKIVTDGLVLHYDIARLRSYPGSGTTLTDISGNNYTGTINEASYSSGQGGILSFDGVNDNIDCGAILGYTTSDFTFSLWVNPSIFGKALISNGTYDDGYTLYIESNGLVSFYTGFEAITAQATSGSPIFDNYWNNICFTKEGGSGKIYIAGEYNTDSDSVVDPSYNTVGLTIGKETNNSRECFEGYIGQVLSYNRALSPDEVLKNYNAVKSRYGF